MNNIATFFRESRVARFLIPSGLILIIFGVFMFVINLGNKDYKQIEALVSDVIKASESYTDVDGEYISETYDITLKYSVNNQEYENKLEGVSKYNIGDKLKIYYNPSNPSEITQTKSLVLPIIIIVVGVISLVGGIISAVNAVKKQKLLKNQEKSWENGK